MEGWETVFFRFDRVHCFSFLQRQQGGGGRGGAEGGGGPRRGGLGARTFQSVMHMQMGKQPGAEGEGAQPQHRYFRNNMRGGRRGGRTQPNNGEQVLEGAGGAGGGGNAGPPRGGRGGRWFGAHRPQRGRQGGKPQGAGQDKGAQDKQSTPGTITGTPIDKNNQEFWGVRDQNEPIWEEKEVHNTTTQSQA